MANSLIGWVKGEERATKALPPPQSQQSQQPPQPQKNQADTNETENNTKTVERECNRISPKAEISDAVLVVLDEDVSIHGKWTGAKAKIQCHTLYVEQGAVVEGEIKAQRINIRGHIMGEISAAIVVVHAGALVEGNVRCGSMKVESRSRIRATVMCDDDGNADMDLPVPVNDPMDGGPRLRMVSAGRTAV